MPHLRFSLTCGTISGMKTRSVLLLVSPSSPGRFAGVARFARSHGWHLTSADRLTHTLDGWTGDGALVTLRSDDAALRHARSLVRRGIPVVDLSATRPDIRLPRVAGDNIEIGRVAAEHLRARCFTRAAWFSTGWGSQHAERFRGFAERFSTAPERWAWALEDRKTRSDDWRALSRWLEKKLRAAKPPLGIFCFDDEDASRVETTALGLGLSIPGDIAVLGAGNDIPLCESQWVPISSVRHNLERNGYVGAALLDRLMNGGRPPPDPIFIKPQGVAERESTDTLAISSPLVRRARDAYREEMANPPSTAQLAERLGVSRATLDRAVAADLGISPAKLLMRLRIDEARRLLRNTKMSVSEIAYALGFCNPAYFTNAFRRAEGSAPRVWRKSLGS